MKRDSWRLRVRVLIAASVIGSLLLLMSAPWRPSAFGQNGSGEGSSNKARSKKTPAKKGATANTNPAKAAARRSFVNAHGIEMLWIPPGSFKMGSNNGRSDEKPVHRVTIGQGFYLSKYELTSGQWLSLNGTSPTPPNYIGHEDEPKASLSWDDAQALIGKLNEMNDGYLYRLPTEAEWEYACRAGTPGDYYAPNVDDIGWYSKNYGSKFHRVGSKKPNAFGLYDMAGSVWEWCEDSYQGSYTGAPADGSSVQLPVERTREKVKRGGSVEDNATSLRSAARSWATLDYSSSCGLRLVAVERPH